jgi:hypothetical protein
MGHVTLKRSQAQRVTYAISRVTMAVDRFLIAENLGEMAKTRRWALAWARFAKLINDDKQ